MATPRRQLFDIALEPIAGSRFQPTGFPDLGAAEFRRPKQGPGGEETWSDALLVESAQSMANRLEAVGWDSATEAPVATLSGLPYMRVSAADDGRYLTSSRTEPHRLASAYVLDAKLNGRDVRDVVLEWLDLQPATPLAPRELAKALFSIDPLCLLHGVFFAQKPWPHQPKLARAVTGFIEADNVRRAESGGSKQDRVSPRLSEKGKTAEGYGFVPFSRTEFTAMTITASFVIDLAQISSYGLGEGATSLLETLARWEIRRLLDDGLRLRTACDLVPLSDDVSDRSGTPLPSGEDLDRELRALIGECRELLGDGQPVEVSWGKGAK